jgi:hypothetical protein
MARKRAPKDGEASPTSTVSIFLTLLAQVVTFVFVTVSNDSSLPLGLGGS